MAVIGAFSVLGPNMIGPSSSHTTGAMAIALLAQKMIAGQIIETEFTLYGSSSGTYRGYGTGRTLLEGTMRFKTNDRRIRNSLSITQQRGLRYSFLTNEKDKDVHPNTVDIRMVNDQSQEMTVRGESLGEGKMRIAEVSQVGVDFADGYNSPIVIHQDKPGVVAHTSKYPSDCNVNIVFMKFFREKKGAQAYCIVESDEHLPLEVADWINNNPHVYYTTLVQVQERMDTGFGSGTELLEQYAVRGMVMSEVMKQREYDLTGVPVKDMEARMKDVLAVMKDSTTLPLREPVTSIGDLIGGESARMEEWRRKGTSALSGVLGRAVICTIAVSEVNTSTGLIVAALTTGSSDIMPRLLLALQEKYGLEGSLVADGLFTAPAVGYLAIHSATVLGAVGGYQAEVGVACVTIAAAAVELMRGTPAQSLGAMSAALMNLLGLICDFMGGLMGCPYQNRNGAGAANTLVCAGTVLNGTRQLVPFDEILETVYTVGRGLPLELRETALGGCTAVPSGCRMGCCVQKV